MIDENEPRKASPRELLIDHAVTLGLIGLVVALSYRIFVPLFPAILWGLLLSVICAHPYERLVARLNGRRLVADLVFAFVLLLVLMVPAIFFAWELITNFQRAEHWLAAVSSPPLPAPPAWLAGLPVVGPSFETAWGTATTDLGKQIPGVLSHLGGVAAWAAARIGSFGAFMFEFTLGAVVSLFVLHSRFAFRAFLNRLLTRIGGAFAGGLLTRALDTTRSAFAGVIYAAIAQTLLAGVGLYVAGLPGVILFMGFTFLLALVQIGPVVVLVIAEAILLFEAQYLTALLLALWFVGVVMTVDNLIRPLITSKGTSLPGIIAFLGTIGGFITWGLIGVFLGPVLTSVIFEMLLTWMNSERSEAE